MQQPHAKAIVAPPARDYRFYGNQHSAQRDLDLCKQARAHLSNEETIPSPPRGERGPVLDDAPQGRRHGADEMVMKTITYSVLTLLALLIVGCGGGDGVTSSSDLSKPSAGQVIKQLQAADVPIDASQELTAANDPNELLGRPGQYTGKAFFHDARLPAE